MTGQKSQDSCVFLFLQFQLKAPPGGAWTPAERGGPAEDTIKWVTCIHHALALILKPNSGLQSKGKRRLVHALFFSSWQGDRRRTRSSSRQRPERPEDSTSAAARYTYTLCQAACVCLWMCGFSQILNLSFCVLLFRRWRSWQTATELTAQIWQRPSLSIHTHKRRSARSGTCVSVCVCVWGLVLVSHVAIICYNRTIVTELKEEVRRLILREHEPTPLLSAHTSGKFLFFSLLA